MEWPDQQDLKDQDHTSQGHLQQLLQDHATIAERITGLGIAHIQEKIGHRRQDCHLWSDSAIIVESNT